MKRLMVFISSTANLQAERSVVEAALSELDIEGSRFESWPSSPRMPLEECLRHVGECEALVLLLGSKYGRKTAVGKSATHLEYEEARRLNKPVFVYLLARAQRESEQVQFIAEVEQDFFRGSEVTDIVSLRIRVRQSFLHEFVRCFRRVHVTLPPIASRDTAIPTPEQVLRLPNDHKEAVRYLHALYIQNFDLAIHQLSIECERLFGDDANVMNFVYMAEVNLGMNDQPYDPKRIAKAIEFWNRIWTRSNRKRAGFAYNIGNALSVLKRYPAAIAKYRAALALESAYPECWKNLGTAYLHHGDMPSALVCFETALKYNPALPETLYSLATICLKERHDPEGALRYLKQIPLDKTRPLIAAGVQAWKAHIFLELGRYSDGVGCAEDAVSLNPKDLWTWAAAARLYVLLRHEDTSWLRPAATFWERFTAVFPNRAEAWIEFGHVAWRLAEIETDEDWKRRAIEYYDRGIMLGEITDEVANGRVAASRGKKT